MARIFRGFLLGFCSLDSMVRQEEGEKFDIEVDLYFFVCFGFIIIDQFFFLAEGDISY